jgi:hypothetical protein
MSEVEKIDLEWNLGPDNLYPAKSYTTCKLNEATKLRDDSRKLTINKKTLNRTPISVYTKFKETVEKSPNKPALGE